MNFGTAWIAFSTITNNETDGAIEDRDIRSGGGGIYNDPSVGSDGFIVVFVFELANDFLEQVFNGDDAFNTTVLVDDKRHLLVTALKAA